MKWPVPDRQAGKEECVPILIIAVGKLREAFWRDAAREYQQRLTRYCKLELVEVQDEKDPVSSSPALLTKAVDTEGARVMEHVRPGDIVVAMCIEGKQLSSADFSAQMKAWHEQAQQVVFVIGGSNGLSDAVIHRANHTLSFSPMTFPHQLARVMLLEQVYRAYKIITGERYHK